MKVTLATDAGSPGGVGRHLTDLARGLRRLDAEVTFAAPAGSAIERTAAEFGSWFVPFEHGVEPADVFHLHLANTYDRRSVAVLARARRRARRVVVTEHLPRSNASDPGLTVDRRTLGAYTAKTCFKRLQLGLADSVIAVSRESRHFLLSRYGLNPDRVRTILNGVDIGHFAPGPARVRGRGGVPSVLAVGSLIWQKGHDVLIRAAGLARRDWTVVIAGAGPQHAALARLADLLAPGRVRFLGWHEDVPALMREATVVCMPSRWESFAYVPVEAMALGRPVVASRVDGVNEYICHGSNGLLVEPDDPAGLAAAIERLLGNPTRAAELAWAGRRDVGRLSVDRMVEQTYIHYRSLR